MKVQIKKSPRGASGAGIPVAQYLRCLSMIFEKQGITHLTSAKFSLRSHGYLSYVLRQRWNKTRVEELDLLAEDPAPEF